MTTKLRSFVTAAVLSLAVVSLSAPALAGKGGSAGQLRSAVASGSVDAIIAEIERTESLMCGECVQTMTELVDHERYEVREAAGWWFAKRPTLKKMMIEQMVEDLDGSGTTARNAAAFLGAVRAYGQMGVLSAAYDRGVSTETRYAIIRAAGVMSSRSGSALIAKGFADADAGVRTLAVSSWRNLRGQDNAAPVMALLTDADANVRAEAAATVGGFRDAAGRAQLEVLVVSDPDAVVRRNAAWALGQIGLRASDAALATAAGDASPLVRGVAKAARLSLR